MIMSTVHFFQGFQGAFDHFVNTRQRVNPFTFSSVSDKASFELKTFFRRIARNNCFQLLYSFIVVR